jgi:hypothetical protein
MNSIKKESKILVEEQFDGKIVVEEGIKFLKQLRAEASRQKAIKEADMTYASVMIEEVPSPVSSAEVARLADEMEITEDDDK